MLCAHQTDRCMKKREHSLEAARVVVIHESAGIVQSIQMCSPLPNGC